MAKAILNFDAIGQEFDKQQIIKEAIQVATVALKIAEMVKLKKED